MLPVAGDLPVEGEWSYEVDWAGVRLLADVDQGVLTLCTADGEDVTARFPEFAGLVDAVADGLLDGEAVMLDGGSPSADALGERLGVSDAQRARALARERPAVFMVYDVMRLYGVPLEPRPLEERRAVLSRLDLSHSSRIQISPAYDDGPALLAGVVAQRLSGVIAKRRGTPYRSGDSVGDWVRVDVDRSRAGAHAAPTGGIEVGTDLGSNGGADVGPPVGSTDLPAAATSASSTATPTASSPAASPTTSRRPRHARRERTPQHDTLF
jgi:ATP-dependent DNA ligase